MPVKTCSCAILGVEALKVVVEVNLSKVHYQFISGLPDTAIIESLVLLEKLDETSALAFTSNRDFVDWRPFFADNTIASAFTNRAVNKSTIIKIVGASHRIRNFERQIAEPA